MTGVRKTTVMAALLVAAGLIGGFGMYVNQTQARGRASLRVS